MLTKELLYLLLLPLSLCRAIVGRDALILATHATIGDTILLTRLDNLRLVLFDALLKAAARVHSDVLFYPVEHSFDAGFLFDVARRFDYFSAVIDTFQFILRHVAHPASHSRFDFAHLLV